MGQVVRLGLLLAMAALTYWKIRTPAAVVLLMGALILGALAVAAFAGA